MNRKISRNEKKNKYSKEEKLALGEDENTSALINFVYLLLLSFYYIHKCSVVFMVRKGEKK